MNTFLTTSIWGSTFDTKLDGERLGSQLLRVLAFMRDGEWHILNEIGQAAHGSEAGVSARLRDLRRPEHGGYTVERRRRGDPKRGLVEYRLVTT